LKQQAEAPNPVFVNLMFIFDCSLIFSHAVCIFLVILLFIILYAPHGEGKLSKFETPVSVSNASLLTRIAGEQSLAAKMLAPTETEQRKLGYFHTLREILQQPATWVQTGQELAPLAEGLLQSIAGIRAMVLTGSGSSEYAGECVRLPLQNSLSIPVETIGGGMLLTYDGKGIGPERPGLMVSLILETEPAIRHLIVTCNAEGRLATTYRDEPRVSVIVLADETNDRGLAMTSSFTNMVLAAGFLGMLRTPERYLGLIEGLSLKAEEILLGYFDTLAELARRDFGRVVYLGTGPRLGAARESALKMLEMTAGRVWSTCESYLGLRHGPMSAVHADTLTVCFLSSDPLSRAYECDLIRELNDKQLGMAKLVFGEDIPSDLARDGDVAIDLPGLAQLGDDHMPVLDVLAGQLLALFRCLKEGLKPDSPSNDGVISRVVQEFRLHRTGE
jgi:tagatose-6-phosphate ketose/aldose isomerase